MDGSPSQDENPAITTFSRVLYTTKRGYLRLGRKRINGSIEIKVLPMMTNVKRPPLESPCGSMPTVSNTVKAVRTISSFARSLTKTKSATFDVAVVVRNLASVS
jgi:hypothetical protein